MSATALNVRLCRLACELDEASALLDAEFLSTGEAVLLTTPIAHLTIALARLEQIVHEVEQLDQHPRLARLQAA